MWPTPLSSTLSRSLLINPPRSTTYIDGSIGYWAPGEGSPSHMLLTTDDISQTKVIGVGKYRKRHPGGLEVDYVIYRIGAP